MYINGDALGGVFGNTSNNNGNDGIQVDGAVIGVEHLTEEHPQRHQR